VIPPFRASACSLNNDIDCASREGVRGSKSSTRMLHQYTLTRRAFSLVFAAGADSEGLKRLLLLKTPLVCAGKPSVKAQTRSSAIEPDAIEAGHASRPLFRIDYFSRRWEKLRVPSEHGRFPCSLSIEYLHDDFYMIAHRSATNAAYAFRQRSMLNASPGACVHVLAIRLDFAFIYILASTVAGI